MYKLNLLYQINVCMYVLMYHVMVMVIMSSVMSSLGGIYMTFLILSLCTTHWDMSGRSLDSLSFWYTANVRVKLRFSQNRKWADKNSSKQFLWRKLRETTNLWVEVMNSKRQVTGKFGHVVKIRVCQLTQTWCLTSLFRGTQRQFS